jgi:hypothetical protein
MKMHLAHGQVDGKPFIPAEALDETYRIHSLTTNNPANFSPSGFYGLGWGLAYDSKGRLRLSHSGAFELGIRTSVTMLPQEGVGIVVLCNGYPSGLPEALSASFLKMYNGEPADPALAQQVNQQVMDMLGGMLGGGYQPAQPAKPSPALPLSSYTGRFANEFYGEAVVAAGEGGLALHLGTRTFPLGHLDRDTFVVVPHPATFEDLGPFELQFAFDGEGKVTGFRQKGLGEAWPWFGKE